MGLDQNDPVIPQRMPLKLEFLLEDLATETASDDEQLTQFMPPLDLAGIDLLHQATHPAILQTPDSQKWTLPVATSASRIL